MKRFKKTAALALMICLLLTLLTGCLKVELDITIKRDGKADIEMIYAMADDAMENGETAVADEEVREYESEGWTVESYAQDGYTGVLLKKQDVDLSEEEIIDGSNGSIRKEGDLYIIDLEMIPKEDQEDFDETADWLKSTGGSFIVRLHLPVKPVTHNATSVSKDGKTLEWDLLEMDGRESVHVEFSAKGGGAAVLGSAARTIGIVAAIALIAGVIFVASKSRAKNVPEADLPVEAVPEDGGSEVPDIPVEVTDTEAEEPIKE
jgi:hypothetical protein